MASAGIDLSIRTDSRQANAGVSEVEDAIRRAGRVSEEANRRSADAAQRNLQLYREETRILDLRARGRNDIADSLRREVDVRRLGMRLERELHVSQQEGIALARRRLALEQQLAEQEARRRAAGGGGPGGDGSGGPPPSGGGPGRGGRGNPPPGGGGGGPPGPNRGRDLNDTYNILQDLIQGGPAAVANQLPQVARLLVQYGGALAGITAAIAGGVGIGAAIADPDGVKGRLVEFANKIDGTIGAFPTPKTISDAFFTWLAKMNDGVEAMEENAKAQGKALQTFNVRREQELGRRRGEAEGGNAENRARGIQQAAERRAAEADAFDENLARQRDLERLRLEGILDEETRRKALIDFDKNWLAEKAAKAKKIADDEYARAAAERKRTQDDLDALERAAEKAVLAPGISGTTPELERINKARPGLESARDMGQEALKAAAEEKAAADAGVKAAADQGKIIDQRAANEDAARDAARNAAATKKVSEDFLNAGQALVKALMDTAKEVPKIGRARAETDQEMQILELRARGQNPKADRLERKNAIASRARDLVDSEGRTPAEAAKMVEREYDLRNPSRRIRGAGFGGRGAAESGSGLDALRQLNSRGRSVGDGPGGASAFPGLDGLDELQKRNQRIRGAGFKGERKTKEEEAKPDAQQGGTGALAAILNALSGVRSDLRSILSASRTVRR